MPGSLFNPLSGHHTADADTSCTEFTIQQPASSSPLSAGTLVVVIGEAARQGRQQGSKKHTHRLCIGIRHGSRPEMGISAPAHRPDVDDPGGARHSGVLTDNSDNLQRSKPVVFLFLMFASECN